MISWRGRIGTASRLLAATLGLPCAAAAQLHTGAIRGVVVDSGGSPLAGVEVLAIRTGLSAHTDTAGRFLLARLPRGTTDLSIRRIAYQPVMVSVEVPDADASEIEIRLGGYAQPLPAVVVSDETVRRRALVDFETHKKAGAGRFITRADIEKRHPLRLSDMVRTIPGATIVPAENGRSVLRFVRSHGGCPPQYFVDGVRVVGFNIDDVLPEDVEGIELYPGPAGLPPEFNQLYARSICGTVAIWTRVPVSSPAKP